ncbi:unnamed protein product [Penicillium olsonii]|nr:unnamed protein product [Penicillium olsonii]CAG7931147.1 unnamed protein product [Penicillium olsonii]
MLHQFNLQSSSLLTTSESHYHNHTTSTFHIPPVHTSTKMSSIIHKVKDAVTHKKSGDHTDHHDTTTESNQSTNHGPHDSNVANIADPRVDSDRSAHNTTSTGHTTEPVGTGASHESGLSSNHGPHDSNLANTADPRVDSDRSAHNTTSTGHSSGPLGTGSSTGAYESGRSSNHGPHDSNIANTADPRVDSDRSAYNTSSTGHSSTGGLGSGAGVGAGTNAYESGRSSNHGPHDSNIANTADPRVDSDRSKYGTGSTGHSSTGHSTTGALGAGAGLGAAGAAAGAHGANHSSNHGPHDSNIANTADPRVDSDRSTFGTGSSGLNTGSHTASVGSGGLGGSHTGSTGYGSNPLSGTHDSSRSSNYGPHDSNVGNAVDPRVDSDLDNRHSSTGTGLNTGSHVGSHSGSTSYGSATPLTGAGNSANAQESARSTNHGPHDSNVANKLDPRVDSDNSKGYDFNKDVRQGSLAGQAEMMHLSHSSGPDTTTRTFEEAHETGAAGTKAPGHGAGSSYNQGRTSHSTAGPHDSNLANKADPRVDSDRDGSNTVGNTTGSTSTTHQRI